MGLPTTQRELLDLVMRERGYKRPEELAVGLDIPFRTIQRWQANKGLKFAETLRLLKAAGLLRDEPDGATREAAPTEADDVLDQALEEIAAVLERLVTRVSEQERPTASATGQRKRRGAAR